MSVMAETNPIEVLRRALDRLEIERVSELEAELEGRIADDSVLCPHAPKHVLEAKLRELETERERLDEVNTGLASQILRLMQERDSALGLLHD